MQYLGLPLNFKFPIKISLFIPEFLLLCLFGLFECLQSTPLMCLLAFQLSLFTFLVCISRTTIHILNFSNLLKVNTVLIHIKCGPCSHVGPSALSTKLHVMLVMCIPSECITNLKRQRVHFALNSHMYFKGSKQRKTIFTFICEFSLYYIPVDPCSYVLQLPLTLESCLWCS